jgi:hypothetical protein
MMVALLLYAYSRGVYSSRRISALIATSTRSTRSRHDLKTWRAEWPAAG